jgi:hypothetical protein
MKKGVKERKGERNGTEMKMTRNKIRELKVIEDKEREYSRKRIM